MIYIQHNAPQPNRSYDYSITNFSGGLNNSSEELGANESPYIVNMSFDNETHMQKRRGQKRYNQIAYQRPVTYIDSFSPYEAVESTSSSSESVVVATDKEVFINMERIADVEGKIDGVGFDGKYFFVDGKKLYVYGEFSKDENTYYKVLGNSSYNGEQLTFEIVNPPPGFIPLPKSETIVKEGDEIGGPETPTETTVSHKQGVLTVDVGRRKIWYEPCEYEMEDTFSGANVVPTNVSCITTHQGRIFVSGSADDNDNVFISDVQTPFYFPATLPMQLNSNFDKVVALTVYDDCVIVGRQHDIYSIRGATNRTDAGVEVFSLKKLNTHTGFASTTCFDLVHNYLFFVGNDGNMYALSAGRVDEHILATQLISRKMDIKKDPINVTLSDLKSVATCYFNDEWYVALKDKVLVYNYNLRAWTVYTGFDAISFTVSNYELIWGTSKGNMACFSDDYLDFGRPFKCSWKSTIYYLESPTYNKYFRYFYILADTNESLSSKINTNIYIDYIDTYREYSAVNSTSMYGTAKWGDIIYSRSINPSVPFYINSIGRSIQFEFSNGYEPGGTVDRIMDLASYKGRKNGATIYCNEDARYYVYDTRSNPEVFDPKAGYGWIPLSDEDINQPMKILQVNFTYETRRRVY